MNNNTAGSKGLNYSNSQLSGNFGSGVMGRGLTTIEKAAN